MPRHWNPSPAIKLSFALHAGVGAGLAMTPGLWPQALALLAANHGVLTLASLLPRGQLLGSNLTRLPAQAVARREIALTVDDGPHPKVTPQVLDLLDVAHAKASFFCIGERAARYPELVREIVARGHAVENHSDNHLKTFALLGPGGMMREVANAQETLQRIAGLPPHFFRPTAGFRNPFLDFVLARLDLRLATWTRRAFDTRCGDPLKVHERLAHGLAAGDILLLHDGNGAPTRSGRPVILEALPRLLESIQRCGLNSVTLHTALEDRHS
jgi:peptidoglycan/xylan/chitin deacetylase (PgdA/CDA1 family)